MLTREIAGRTWYVEARCYPTGLMAKRAWERAERKLIRGPGEDGIGITRLGPNPAGGTPTGLGDPGHAVVVVTLDEQMMRRAQRLLKDGRVVEPSLALADAMIARRARVVLAQQGTDGRLVIRRPEGRGAQFDQLGEVIEPEPGQG